jgi:uncharacterized membrane protein
LSTTKSAAKRRRSQEIRSATRETPAGDRVATTRDPDAEPDGYRTPVDPRWPAAIGVVICVLGLGISAYLTVVHYQGIAPICPAHAGIIDCEAVVTSQWSTIFGVPVPVLGLVFFAGMLPLQLPASWRSQLRWVRVARMAGSVVSIGMILWLVYVELFLVGRICLWCTSVHVLTFVLFCTTLFGTLATTPEPDL